MEISEFMKLRDAADTSRSMGETRDGLDFLVDAVYRSSRVITQEQWADYSLKRSQQRQDRIGGLQADLDKLIFAANECGEIATAASLSAVREKLSTLNYSTPIRK